MFMKSKTLKTILNSSFIQSAGIYTITNGINSAIPFLLMPVLTRYLSPVDYGITTMFGVLLSFISPFTGLSVSGAIQRQYYHRDQIDLPRYVANCLLLMCISSTLVFLLFMFFSNQISKLSSVPQQWLWVVIIVSIGQIINQITLVFWQVQIKPLAYGSFQVGQTIINAVASVLLVVFWGKAWQGRIEAQVIAVVLFAFIALFILFKDKWLNFSIDFSYIKNALNFGLPLIPHTLGSAIVVLTDRFFITKMVGLDATGIYTVGYQIGIIIGLLHNSFAQAYVPRLFEGLKRNNSNEKKNIVKFTYIYCLTLILLALGWSLIAPIFLKIFVGKKFWGSSIFILWIALGCAFDGMYQTVVNYFFFTAKTNYLAFITAGCACSNIALNYIFIKINGPIGAAQATALTYLLTFICTWILSNKIYPMPWFNYRN